MSHKMNFFFSKTNHHHPEISLDLMKYHANLFSVHELTRLNWFECSKKEQIKLFDFNEKKNKIYSIKLTTPAQNPAFLTCFSIFSSAG